jgi:amino acid adenylation domain-containing protein
MLQQDNTQFSTRRADLSERKRILLEKRLRGERASVSEAPSITRLSQQGPVLLSLTQQGLWILDQLMVDSPLYNIFTALRFTGSLNIPVLQRSLDAIVLRHETLRTTFQVIEGQPMQVIADSASIPLSIVDLRRRPQAVQEAEVRQLASEEVQRPFTLTQEPLLRAMVIHIGADTSLLLLTMHHIISDGWSLGVFVQELTTLYEAYSNDLISPLSTLPIQYADFAIWQHKMLQGEAFTDHLAYWKQQLAGSPEMLALPTDRPRLPTLTTQGSSYQMVLPEGLATALKKLSQQEGVTLYMMLVAAFQTLLCRYSGQEDIVIGTVNAGRTQEEVGPLIGFFANTLVLRTSLAGNPTFKELLQRVRKVLLEAHEHQVVPFEVLVKELQPERQVGQNPIFQVIVTLNPSLPNLPKGWMPAPMTVESKLASFDLVLELEELPKGLVANFEYRTDLFDEATIVRMAGHWQTLLEGIIAEPTRQVTKLPLLTAAEERCLLEEWNATQADYPKELCVHELFEEQVQRAPEAIAVVLEGAQLTYQELNRRANQLAHHLQQQGVGPEVLVGLCLERSLEVIVGILGVIKAGGAYVPLDPDTPPERFAFVLRDSQMAVLLTQKSLQERLPECHPPVVCLDADWQVISQHSQANPPRRGTSQHLAYVIYTSGSTGQPKGVLIEHRSLMAHCWSIMHEYELSAADRILQFHTFTFDPSVEQILSTLVVGARLVLRGEEIWSPGELLDKIKQQQLTVLSLPSAYWQQALQEWVRSPQQLPGLPLRFVMVGGERLLPEVVQLWRRTPLGSVRLLNVYGPTETTIAATFYDVAYDQDEGQTVESIPIGRPLANRTIYILDRTGNPVPIGVAGELYIGGVGVVRGYLNRSDLTAERFIPDPFSGVSEARLYRTGDIARYRGDGNIEFLGRVDDQVKIRGYRIEPGEIEAVLNGHPAVRQSVVVAREDIPRDKYLVAYLVLHAEESVKPDDLKSYMAKLVPTYMVPSAFVLLQTLPLMTSGKVDRRALPAPDFSSRTIKEDFVAPKHMLHFQLIAIWEDLLNVHPIGIRDNFFNIGGHSLLAVLLLARIEQVFHQKLQFNTLFANPTIEGLAEVLQTKVGNDLQLPIIAIQAGEAKRPLFFLHGQWRGDAFYCYPLARTLGKEQPFYAIPPYQLSGVTVAPTMEEIAAAHIKTLQSVQPYGPYSLGGWCNGALVAYEMARQLHTQGQAIDSLILVNPSALTPSVRLKSTYKIVSQIGRLFHLSLDKQLNCFLRFNHVSLYLLSADYRETVEVEQLRAAAQTRWDKWGKRRGALLSHLQLFFPPIESLHTYLSIFPWISANYEPLSQYSGKISFLWHRDGPFDRVAWQQVIEANDFEEYYLPGTHTTLLTDHLSDMAKQIQFCLNEANDL